MAKETYEAQRKASKGARRTTTISVYFGFHCPSIIKDTPSLRIALCIRILYNRILDDNNSWDDDYNCLWRRRRRRHGSRARPSPGPRPTPTSRASAPPGWSPRSATAPWRALEDQARSVEVVAVARTSREMERARSRRLADRAPPRGELPMIAGARLMAAHECANDVRGRCALWPSGDAHGRGGASHYAATFCTSAAKPACAARTALAVAGATPRPEGLVRVRAQVCLRTPAPVPLGVAPGQLSLRGKAVRAPLRGGGAPARRPGRAFGCRASPGEAEALTALGAAHAADPGGACPGRLLAFLQRTDGPGATCGIRSGAPSNSPRHRGERMV